MSSPEVIQTKGWHYAFKWNWDYQEAWDFQKKIVQRVRDSQEKWLIACSHPPVLTYGRGLQKPKPGQRFSLTEFKPESYATLPLPCYRIERGGGLTFHHPGQLILYPIVKLHPSRLGLSELVKRLLSTTCETLKAEGLQELDYQRELLGLWHKNHKLASVGIAVDRMVTYHGLALNVQRFDALKQQLSFLSPCGMGFESYTSVEELSHRKLNPADLLPEISRRFFDAWE